MKEKKYSIKNLIVHPDSQIWIVSILFGIIVSMGKSGGDDTRVYASLGTGISGLIKWTVDQYYTWSSRLLINFVWGGILKCGRIAWFIYMCISMFVMLKALKLLFGEKNKRIELFAIAMLMIIPFETITNAGWIATTTSYFGPQAFAVMGLVPISKVLAGKTIKSWEFVLYCLCLLYGANAEQMCVVLVVCYLVASIYMIVNNKKYDYRIALLTVLSVVSLIFTMTCPGNLWREKCEEMSWFPTYGMLDIIDKADIGLSTTLKWMLASGKIFIIFICCMMTYFVWKKYKEPIYRFISIVPTIAVILFGPFSEELKSVFPYLHYAVDEINYYGLFTADVSKIGIGATTFLIFMGILVCICVEIFLLNDNICGIIIDFTLASMAVASRAMMGFSPTVYASDSRTYTTLIFCMCVFAVHIYSSNYLVDNSEKCVHREKYIMYGLTICGFLNLIYLVATEFY